MERIFYKEQSLDMSPWPWSWQTEKMLYPYLNHPVVDFLHVLEVHQVLGGQVNSTVDLGHPHVPGVAGNCAGVHVAHHTRALLVVDLPGIPRVHPCLHERVHHEELSQVWFGM